MPENSLLQNCSLQIFISDITKVFTFKFTQKNLSENRGS